MGNYGEREPLVKVADNSKFQEFPRLRILTGRYHQSLSVDATLMVSNRLCIQSWVNKLLSFL